MEVMKRARQEAIGDVVRSQRVHTQEQLVEALAVKGFRASQATVSRDVADMGLVKVSRGGSQAYALPSSDAVVEQSSEQRLTQLLQDLPVDVRESGTLLVIRAVPGSAHAIASALDRARWPGVLGTIAGDDTLFVACADAKALRRTRKRLLRIGR